MKTNELIAALAADAARPGPPMGRAIGGALMAGGAAAAAAFALTLGTRPDLAAAIGSWRFLLKLALVAVVLAVAVAETRRLARPTVTHPRRVALITLVALVAGVVALELMTVPVDAWAAHLLGQNALVCLTAIPALAMAPLAALILAMRRGAPRSGALAGAVSGLAAAALAGLLYGLHCSDDSPLFVVAWYGLAMLLVGAAGALAGHRLLRW